MSKLKTSTRKADKFHAGNAKARATQMVSAGKLSPAAASRIRAKANQILGKES